MNLLKLPALCAILWMPAAVSANAAPYFVHCYDFGCKTTMEIRYDAAQWQPIVALFHARELDRDQEKQAIRQAVAMMERISGEMAGTYRDQGGNYPGYDISKQMDCIDESTNTFQYLAALEASQLLKHHRVDRKYRRIVWFISHWTAAIVDLADNRRYAVDSWYRDNGEPPYIQPLDEWQRKRDWPLAYNPELVP